MHKQFTTLVHTLFFIFYFGAYYLSWELRDMNTKLKPLLFIAQIVPLSFQAALAHKLREVRWGELHAPVVTEWSPACLHK